VTGLGDGTPSTVISSFAPVTPDKLERLQLRPHNGPDASPLRQELRTTLNVHGTSRTCNSSSKGHRCTSNIDNHRYYRGMSTLAHRLLEQVEAYITVACEGGFTTGKQHQISGRTRGWQASRCNRAHRVLDVSGG